MQAKILNSPQFFLGGGLGGGCIFVGEAVQPLANRKRANDQQDPYLFVNPSAAATYVNLPPPGGQGERFKRQEKKTHNGKEDGKADFFLLGGTSGGVGVRGGGGCFIVKLSTGIFHRKRRGRPEVRLSLSPQALPQEGLPPAAPPPPGRGQGPIRSKSCAQTLRS